MLNYSFSALFDYAFCIFRRTKHLQKLIIAIKMKNYYVIFAFLFMSVKGYCQIPQQSSGQVVTGSNISIFNNPDFSKITLESRSKVTKYQNIEGSPYINNNSEPNKNLTIGKFYSPEFEYIVTALARYNAYTDNMEVSLMDDGVDYYFLRKKTSFLYIVLGKTTYRAYVHNDAIGFFVILSKNDTEKCVFLKKQRILFKKEEETSSSFDTGTSDSFKRVKDKFYFKFEDLILEIPKKKKTFYKLFKEKEIEIKQYVETNKLKIKKEKDLLKISKYYNTLFD